MGWNFNSQAPVYLQIVARIRADILAGRYAADAPFPSVRQLAYEAAVNPNTMQRALTELENDGLLYTRGTAGRFVTGDREVLQAARSTAFADEIDLVVGRAKALGMSKAELLRLISDKEEWSK